MSASRSACLVAATAALCCLALAASASAAGRAKPVKVEILRAAVGAVGPKGGSLLVAVRYPIQLARRPVELSASLLGADGSRLRRWTVRAAANSGAGRQPERRRGFTFVHRLPLGVSLARRLRGGLEASQAAARPARPRLLINARAVLDVEEDGIAELRSGDRELHAPKRVGGAGRLCASVPRLRTRPGRRVSVALPSCTHQARWRIARRPQRGTARIRRGRLIYSPGPRFRGSASIGLRDASLADASLADAGGTSVGVEVIAKAGEGAVVRAIGDSVTAGFGYFDDGGQMSILQLPHCRPPEPDYDDACSSNSTVRSNEVKEVEYAPDYGLANNVSWAAQWANEHGIRNYANLAVSGSEPSDWAPGGQLYGTTKRIETERPDYILMTAGANPLLSNMLFGIDNMGCAIWSRIFGGFDKCVEAAFAKVELRQNLERLYRELVTKTDAVVYLMQYHLSVPASALAYSSVQIAAMGALTNREIAAAAAAVDPGRLRPVAPPHFNVGIDLSPVYPSPYTCSYWEYPVDGPSVQSDPTQDELALGHPLSFCEGPQGGGPPWVISGDTGIHPSAVGYAQMAAQVPPPGGGGETAR